MTDSENEIFKLAVARQDLIDELRRCDQAEQHWSSEIVEDLQRKVAEVERELERAILAYRDTPIPYTIPSV